jgi:hypothetical protein
MKAHKGDQIVCKCAQPAGHFDRDVEDLAHISSRDIVFSVPLAHHGSHRHVCPTCHEPVAYFLGDRWRVKTRKGFIE